MSLFKPKPATNLIGIETVKKLPASDAAFSIPAPELASDEAKAKAYVLKREDEAKRLMRDLKWQPGAVSWTIDAELYGCTVRHELRERTLHATPCWGEMYLKGDEEPVMFLTLDNFIAFVLARWW